LQFFWVPSVGLPNRTPCTGLLFNFCVAAIGVLMIYLCSECKPSKYADILLGVVAQGGTSLDEVLPILQQRERRIALERARVARRRAEKRAGD
jgi:hypothetical protein